MRKIAMLPLAAMLALLVASPVAAGSHVTNQSGTFSEAYGDWSSYDAGTDLQTDGNVWVVQESGKTGIVESLFEESGRYVDCSTLGAITKDSTGGGFGFQGTITYGYGDATLTIGRKLSTASATGSIYVETDAVDDCAGTYDVLSSGTATLTLSMTGTGSVITVKDSSSVKIPSELNGHQAYTGQVRQASGTVSFGSGPRTFSDATFDTVTWTDHCNGSGC